MMRWIKITLLFLGGTILLCMLLLAIVLATFDNDDYKRLLTRAVMKYSGYQLIIEGPFSLNMSMEPSLSASTIRLEDVPDKTPPPITHIGKFEIKIALLPLLSRTVLIKNLLIDDATFFWVIDEDRLIKTREKSRIKTVSDINLPILENVTLRNINVNISDQEMDDQTKIMISHFNIDDDRDTGTLHIKGNGTVNSENFLIAGQIGTLTEVLDETVPYPVELALKIANLDFKVSGTIDDFVKGEGLNIDVSVEEADLSNILKVVGVDIPELGHLNLKGTITGSVEAPGVSDFKVSITGGNKVEFSAKGSAANLISGDGTNIAISGSSSNSDVIQMLFPDDYHDLSGFTFEGRLSHFNEDYKLDDVIISVSHEKGTTLRANGGLVLGDNLFSPDVRKTDLKLQLTAQDTKPLKRFLFDWLPDTGPVTGKARLIGPVEQLVLENLNISAGQSNTVWISVKGRLGRIPINSDSQVSGVDMSLSIESEQPSLLFTGLDVSIPEMDSVSARARMHGNGDNLLFDEINVRMTDSGGVTTEVSGSAGLEQRENKAHLGRFNLDVNMTALSIKSFRRLLVAKNLPDLGPVHASTHVTGTTEIMAMENFVLKAGYPGPVRFELSGRVGKIDFKGEQPLSGIDLVSHTYAEKSSDFSPLIGIVLPDLGPIEITSRIVNRKEGYGADNIKYIIGTKDNILLKGTGSVEYLMRGTSVAMEGVNLFVEIRDLDAQALSGLFGQRISGLGKLKGSFSVSGSMNDLSVSDADLLMTSPEGLKISARGDIKHIRPEEDNPFQEIIMELSATAPNMIAIQKITDLDFPDLGPVSMSASVNDRDGSLNIETLQIQTGPEKKPTLLVEGQMHDILSMEQIGFSVSFEAATRPWLEEFYGHSVPEEHRLKGKVSLSGSIDHFDIEGTATSGKTNVKTAIEISRVNERRRVVVNVSAPKIYLDDLGIYPETWEKKEMPKKEKKIRREKIFSDEPYPFPKLKDMDLSFRLDTEEVIGSGFILNDLDIDVVLKDGLMLIGPARVTYADGFVSLESTLDMRGSKPEMKLNLKAEDIDIADLFSYAHSPMVLGGRLNLSIDLQSSGGSARSLASALNGELGVAIEHGQIKQTADLLGADVIDFVTTTRKLGTYQKLNCLALNFEFNDGIGNSQVIYIDTPSVRSQGKGTVNFREETVDFIIQPKPKKGRLGGSSAVMIKGPLAKPSASKLPFKEAARLYGEIFIPYVFLPARALGYVSYLMTSDKDEKSPCFSQDN